MHQRGRKQMVSPLKPHLPLATEGKDSFIWASLRDVKAYPGHWLTTGSQSLYRYQTRTLANLSVGRHRLNGCSCQGS